MKIDSLLSDQAVLTEIGQRLTQRRLDLALSQAQVAEQAGIGKRTLERMEAGASSQLVNLIRVLRVLDLLPGLEQLLPPGGPRPMDLLANKTSRRRRAPRQEVREEPGTWTWDDDA